MIGREVQGGRNRAPDQGQIARVVDGGRRSRHIGPSRGSRPSSQRFRPRPPAPPETEKNLCTPAGVASTDRRGRDVHARGSRDASSRTLSLTVYINRRLHARCFNREGLASASRRRASYSASNRFSPKHSPSSFFPKIGRTTPSPSS